MLQPASVPLIPEEQLWKEAVAPDGKVYFFHAITKQTSWVKPAAPGLLRRSSMISHIICQSLSRSCRRCRRDGRKRAHQRAACPT